MVYLFLAIAIVLEIVSLTALKETDGFTRILPSALFVVALAASFYFEALTLRTLPLGLTYTVWAGLGIVGMTLVGVAFYGDRLNPGVVIGVALIVAGVAVLHHWTPVAEEDTAVQVAETGA